MYSLGCWSHLPTQTPLQGSSWLWNLAQEMRINEPINCSSPGAAPEVTQDGKATLVLPCSGSSSCGSNADPDVMPLPSKCKSFIHTAVAEMIPKAEPGAAVGGWSCSRHRHSRDELGERRHRGHAAVGDLLSPDLVNEQKLRESGQLGQTGNEQGLVARRCRARIGLFSLEIQLLVAPAPSQECSVPSLPSSAGKISFSRSFYS